MKLAAIGECMLEITHPNGQDLSELKLDFGGDTLNTLVYASRLGINVSYCTALGVDNYSEWLLSKWKEENIKTDFVFSSPQKIPGIYSIQTDSMGERSFKYWREDSAAKDLFNLVNTTLLVDKLSEMDVIYLSGISASIFSEENREKLLEVLRCLKDKGKTIAYDGNYRPRNWLNKEEAQRWNYQFLRIVDWYLPTLSDERLLYDLESVDDVFHFHAEHGVSELVVKNGKSGASVYSGQQQINVPVSSILKPVDTTSAGDAFNAGYIAARMHGQNPYESAVVGHDIAGQVIMHRGAIMDKATFRPVDLCKLA